MLRKVTAGVALTGAVIVGLVAQAGAYLLALPTPTTESPADDAVAFPYGEPGPHAVGVRQLSGDEAPLPMTVWYPGVEDATRSAMTYANTINMIGPETAIALATYGGEARSGLTARLDGGPYPLVILTHGFAIGPGSYGWLAEHLASWGMVVLAPHHRESLNPAVLWQSTVSRPRDLEAVLDFVDLASKEGNGFHGLIDTDTVGVVGHSYGGYAALIAGGALLDLDSLENSCAAAYTAADPLVFLCDALAPNLDEIGEVEFDDHRIDAVVSMAGDAAMFGEEGLAELDIPVMVVGGTADTDTPFEWGPGLTYDHISSPRKVQVALEGAGHMVFTGECEAPRRLLGLAPAYFCADGTWDRGVAHDLVSGIAAAFLLAELHGDGEASESLAAADWEASDLALRSEGY